MHPSTNSAWVFLCISGRRGWRQLDDSNGSIGKKFYIMKEQ